jgi:hypothetical protein
MFEELYLLESWEVDCVYFADGRARIVDLLRTHLVQV